MDSHYSNSFKYWDKLHHNFSKNREEFIVNVKKIYRIKTNREKNEIIDCKKYETLEICFSQLLSSLIKNN